jgi:pantoate--beta-alanine ligase
MKSDSNTPLPKTVPVITRVKEMKTWRREAVKSGLRVGFVPTMGALHEGHASLIRKSRQKDDATVVSIFVNPTQFNDPSDLEKYPRAPEKDLELCAREGAAAVFMPSVEEMYKKDDRTVVEVHELTDVLCGMSRAGHFRGVCTVVKIGRAHV